MLTVLRQSWALLLGVMLLMLGNGIQGTLLGIRGRIEGFSTQEMSYVMSAYFIGFLFGSRLVPGMIRRVGHVRVFAALGSLISAVLVMYPVLPDWTAWALMRVAIGFSFSGVYITAESWLNNASTNETRGQALSMYMIMQMIGIIGAQVFVNFGDPAGFVLFVIPSVLVSLAFTPILLAATPVPAFDTTRRLPLVTLFRASPLGFVGMFLLGGVFSAQFGMASVWGTLQGLSVRELTIFIAAIYVGGLVFQYPIGWASDRMDRRVLILALAAVGAVVTLAVAAFDAPFWLLVTVGMATGAISNPLYSLIIAYVNDYLGKEEMAAASAGLLFVNGVGAIAGPIITGWLMGRIGPPGFFVFMGVLFALIAGYAAWRMTRRAAAPSGAFVAVAPTATPFAVEAAYDPQSDGATSGRD